MVYLKMMSVSGKEIDSRNLFDINSVFALEKELDIQRAEIANIMNESMWVYDEAIRMYIERLEGAGYKKDDITRVYSHMCNGVEEKVNTKGYVAQYSVDDLSQIASKLSNSLEQETEYTLDELAILVEERARRRSESQLELIKQRRPGEPPRWHMAHVELGAEMKPDSFNSSRAEDQGSFNFSIAEPPRRWNLAYRESGTRESFLVNMRSKLLQIFNWFRR